MIASLEAGFPLPLVREVPHPRERNASLADGLNPQRQARHYWGRCGPRPNSSLTEKATGIPANSVGSDTHDPQ